MAALTSRGKDFGASASIQPKLFGLEARQVKAIFGTAPLLVANVTGTYSNHSLLDLFCVLACSLEVAKQ